MAHTAGLRATSFVASAALLGLATIAALTMSLSMRLPAFTVPDSPVLDIVEEPPPAPPPPRTRDVPPPRLDEPQTAISDPPPIPFDDLPADLGVGHGVVIGPPLVENPSWLRRPRDLARYYPRRALELGVEGQVTLDCLVLTTGRLSCTVASETPQNWGFAAAALRISGDYQMVPATRNGVPVEARYRMRIPFELR